MNFNASPERFLTRANSRRFRAFVIAVLSVTAAFSARAQTTNATDFESFQIISQRNIFNQNRVPHSRSTHVAPPVVDSFALVGTMSYAKGEFAFFNGSSPEFRKVLQLDGEIAHFKVTDITSKTVTLSDGTNQMVLNLQMQMRRDDKGNWVVAAEPASYSSAGSTSGSGSRSQYSSRRRTTAVTAGAAANNAQTDNANMAGPEEMPPPGTEDVPPEAAAAPGAGANDPLSRLMQRRAQEEQQLGR